MPTFTADTFTDAAATLLENHAGATGATWTKNAAFPTGSAAVTAAGRLRGNATNAVYYASGVPASADYDVEADVFVASNAAAAGLVARMSTSAATYYLLDYEVGSASWKLYAVVAGSTLATATAAQALTVGQTYHVRLSLRGSSITCYVDGAAVIAIDDTSISAAGRAGLFFAAADSDSTGYHLDNFNAATPATAAVTDANLFFSPYNWQGNGGGAVAANNLPAGSTLARANAPGAYLKFNLAAAAAGYATLLLDTSSLSGITAGNCPTLSVSLDGKTFVSTLLAYSATPKRLSISTNLSAGAHTVTVFFKSVTLNSPSAPGDRWNTPASCVAVTALELDGKGSATAAPTLRTKRMLAYGDSITEGADALGSANANADQDATQTYAQLLAAALDAEVGVVGFSAQGYTVGGYGNVPKLYDTATPANSAFDKFFAGSTRFSGGLLTPAPDYVLLLHGTNDAAQSASDASVTASISALLPALRAAAPAAHLFVAIPFNGSKRSAITAAVTGSADARTHLLDLGAAVQPTVSSNGINTNDALHPNARGHAALAALLLPQIQPFLTSSTPATFQASTGSFAT